MKLTPGLVRLLGAVLLLAFVAFAVRTIPLAVRSAFGDYLAFSDFFAQWSFAWFARLNEPALIYDPDTLHSFQLTLEPALRQTFPFPYPPTYLLAIWPLGRMGYRTAYLAWDLATLALFLWAVFGTRARTVLLWFVLLAPVTLICLGQGQNGLLTSALIVGGMRMMGERPVLGGLLLGLATIKPQLGVLIPIALIGAGYWRTLAAACVTAVVLGIVSGLVLGWAMWPAWLGTLTGHVAFLDQGINAYLKPTIMANMVLLGVALPVAYAIQAGVASVVVVAVFWCFRRGATDLSIAALQIGTFLAMPYVFRYDMPMVANAILLLVRDRELSKQPVSMIEAGIIAFGLLEPAVTTLTSRFFWFSGLSLVLLFGLAVWRRLEEGDGNRAGRKRALRWDRSL